MAIRASSSILARDVVGAMISKNTPLPCTIGTYIFTKRIGHGGFSEVFAVTHVTFNTEFVAKVMTFDNSEIQEKWEAFENEIRSLLLLNHPHVIRMYDHFHVGTQFYVILEYCRGGSLSEEILETSGMSMERFIEMGSELAHAFAYCHSCNIAHCDIKPGNILLDDYKRPKIADFGLSLISTAGEKHRQFAGSVIFTAPEITQKKPNDPMAGDVWALGVVYAMMVTGNSPWKHETIGEMKTQAAQGILTFTRHIPADIEDLIRSMIVVEPTQRVTMEDVKNHPVFRQKVPQPVTYRGKVDVRWRVGPPSSPRDADDGFGSSRSRSKVLSALSALRHRAACESVRSRVHVVAQEDTQKPALGDFSKEERQLALKAASRRGTRESHRYHLVIAPGEGPQFVEIPDDDPYAVHRAASRAA
jgi:serine/threonine protein kinase